MSGPSPNDEEAYLERLRSVWKEPVELEEPSPEMLARAKAAFRRQQEQKQRRVVYLLIVIVVFLVAGAILLFLLAPRIG